MYNIRTWVASHCIDKPQFLLVENPRSSVSWRGAMARPRLVVDGGPSAVHLLFRFIPATTVGTDTSGRQPHPDWHPPQWTTRRIAILRPPCIALRTNSRARFDLQYTRFGAIHDWAFSLICRSPHSSNMFLSGAWARQVGEDKARLVGG
jgi:hypothetical protein